MKPRIIVATVEFSSDQSLKAAKEQIKALVSALNPTKVSTSLRD